MMQSPDPGLAVAEGESVRALLGLATAFWPGDDRSDAAELQRLVQEGFERGVLNYDEIAAGLEDVELTKEQIEDFYTLKGAKTPVPPGKRGICGHKA